jgi:outer membrane protein
LSRITTLSKWIRSIAVCATCVVTLTPAEAQDIRIAFFDGPRVMNESGAAKNAATKIEQEFLKRSKDLQEISNRLKTLAQKFDKEAPTLSESDRIKRQRELSDVDQDFSRKQRIFNEDLGQRKNEEIAAIVERAQKIVRQIAETEKYDIVLQDAVYFNPRIDITDKVLKALAK